MRLSENESPWEDIDTDHLRAVKVWRARNESRRAGDRERITAWERRRERTRLWTSILTGVVVVAGLAGLCWLFASYEFYR
jgi:ferric-dicitrate binding protein FerR (iron transport regulator)